MGTTASYPHQRIQERSRQASSHLSSPGQQQTQILPLPPQHPPSVISALPDLAMSTSDHVAIPESSDSIMASAIPEVYFSNDMVHIDSPEPAVSMDPSVPSYVSSTGEISQAYPEADPYITNYVELYGIPPPPPLDDPNGIRDPNFRDSFVIINGIKLSQPRKKLDKIPTREEFIASFRYNQTFNF